MPTIHHYSRTHRRRAVPSAMWSQPPAAPAAQPALQPAGLARAIEQTAAERIPSAAEGPLWLPPAHQPDPCPERSRRNLHVPSPLLPPAPDPQWPTLPQLTSRIPEGLKATVRHLWQSIAPAPRPPHPYLAALRAQQELV